MLPWVDEGKATINKDERDLSDNCELRVKVKDYLLIIFGEFPGLLSQCSTRQHCQGM